MEDEPIENPSMPFPHHLLDWQSRWLTYFAPVILVAQLACVVHAIRSGRPYWWIWVIMGFPVVGIGAYLFLEVRPRFGRLNMSDLLWRLKSPAARVQIRREQLGHSNTVRNRLMLADELHTARMFDDECQTLEDGLRGVFKDDATLRLRLAEAHLEAGRPHDAEQVLSATTPEKSPESRFHFSLLQARLHSHFGRATEAEQLFRDITVRRLNESPVYYLAEHYVRAGRADDARPLLQGIIVAYRRGTSVWRFQEERWFRLAKQLLKDTQSKRR